MMGWLGGGHGMAVMTNSDAGGVLGEELMHAIAAEYGWKGLAPTTIFPVRMEPERLAEFAGRFAIPDTPMEFTVALKGEALKLIVPGGEPVQLVLTGEDTLVEAMSGQTGTLDRDDDGAVRALLIGGEFSGRSTAETTRGTARVGGMATGLPGHVRMRSPGPRIGDIFGTRRFLASRPSGQSAAGAFQLRTQETSGLCCDRP